MWQFSAASCKAFIVTQLKLPVALIAYVRTASSSVRKSRSLQSLNLAGINYFQPNNTPAAINH